MFFGPKHGPPVDPASCPPTVQPSWKNAVGRYPIREAAEAPTRTADTQTIFDSTGASEGEVEGGGGMVMWVFGYGSLVWNPGFAYDARLVGFVRDYRRVFYQGGYH